MSMPGPPDLALLEQKLGHRFQRRELLERALTHSSFANQATGVPDNERLEFLGDSVLAFVTARHLFIRFPAEPEGGLSKRKAHLVSERHLAEVASALGLGRFLRLGRGEERSGLRQNPAVMVDALEAILAALLLDGGLEAAERFILAHIIEPELRRRDAQPHGSLASLDHKSALQEWAQSRGYPPPAYRVTQEKGPAHRRHFVVELRVRASDGGSERVLQGEGPTKKRAEQQAARLALAELQPPDLGTRIEG
jgi:ribonuclease-3